MLVQFPTEPIAEIEGPSERYIQVGSSVRLTCVLKYYTDPPNFLFWYHNDRVINYSDKRKVSNSQVT